MMLMGNLTIHKIQWSSRKIIIIRERRPMHSVMWLSYWYMVNISIPMPQENYSTNEIIIAGYLSPASFTWINKQTGIMENKYWRQKKRQWNFDLIITFCFNLYNSWRLSDKYTFKQVTFDELQTFLSAEYDKVLCLNEEFPFRLHLVFHG